MKDRGRQRQRTLEACGSNPVLLEYLRSILFFLVLSLNPRPSLPVGHLKQLPLQRASLSQGQPPATRFNEPRLLKKNGKYGTISLFHKLTNQ